ncbi:PD40 domain-containing protein [Tenggerimyces flavus]|uniref:PD40 domain-containing protein n=1 Tax=Tenggerimyces flavus TaxID=1708749 RepID=A0ABV7Y3J4_9ACTN|nr:PD40 domain-containing protein [Tenggerimyces flavus]MBM7790817.1 hypothetical protein [Tenggerimyces flavus]
MNLREELDRIAENAPPLSPAAADLALTRARRRRYVQAPLVVAAVAMAVVGGLAIRPNLFGTDFVPAAPWGKRIEVPATADNLPAQGVGPARLAYATSCGGSPTATPDCVEPRIMTEDNKHWAVVDARPSTNGKEAITVSPDGKQIAYTRGDWLVLRELASGTVTPLFELEDTTYGRAMWAPASKAVAFNLTVSGKSQTKLVDVMTGKVTATLKDGWLLGLPNAEALIPFDTLDEQELPMVDRTGVTRGTLPNALSLTRDRSGATGLVSPDGKHLAVVMRAVVDDPAQIRTLRLEPPRVPIYIGMGSGDGDADRHSVLGWLDNERVLISNGYLDDSRSRQELVVVDAETEQESPFTEVVGSTVQDSISVATDLL